MTTLKRYACDLCDEEFSTEQEALKHREYTCRNKRCAQLEFDKSKPPILEQKVKIDLEFECTAPEGKCAWKETPGECVSSDEDDESWVCWYLKAKAVLPK